MSLTELIESLTLIAGQHGIGRLSWHHRDGGTTHCEISEAPAAQVLQLAYASVQASVLPPDFIRVQQELSLPYSEIVRSGRWFSPLREALDAFSARVQPKVTGLSQVHLLKGEARVGSAQEVVSFA